MLMFRPQRRQNQATSPAQISSARPISHAGRRSRAFGTLAGETTQVGADIVRILPD